MLFFPAPANGKWSTGLCGWCAEPGGGVLCNYVCNNSGCVYGTIVEQLHPSEVLCSGSFCGACLLYSIAPPPCSWYMHISVRKAIKRKYGIKPEDDFCDDCIFPVVCGPCALCQEVRELAIHKHRGAVADVVHQMVQMPMPGYGGQVMMVPAQPGYPPEAGYPPQAGYPPK